MTSPWLDEIVECTACCKPMSRGTLLEGHYLVCAEWQQSSARGKQIISQLLDADAGIQRMFE